jgi:hypothetical protein
MDPKINQYDLSSLRLNIEALNLDCQGSLIGYNANGPVYAPIHYATNLIEPAYACVQKCLNLIEEYHFSPCNPESINVLIKNLAEHRPTFYTTVVCALGHLQK